MAGRSPPSGRGPTLTFLVLGSRLPFCGSSSTCSWGGSLAPGAHLPSPERSPALSSGSFTSAQPSSAVERDAVTGWGKGAWTPSGAVLSTRAAMLNR